MSLFPFLVIKERTQQCTQWRIFRGKLCKICFKDALIKQQPCCWPRESLGIFLDMRALKTFIYTTSKQRKKNEGMKAS